MTNHPSHAAKVQKLFHIEEKKHKKLPFTPSNAIFIPSPKQKADAKHQSLF